MSLIDRIQTRRPRPARKHRAADEVEQLRLKLMWADSLIKTQRVQLDDAEARRAWTASQQTTAEELVVKLQADVDDLTAERDQLADDLADLRARFAAEIAEEANATAITLPPSVRPIDGPEDQATEPIDVRTLHETAAAGRLGPVTDPGHTTSR
ncbi:hypothetical protein [Streptomyces sp. NPDC057052]|uniref:hypothetical protein n=1 Tax=Streptomyces sp. NPDC057052 TaxID=3346010 RepID=UPI00362E7011